jgi:DNA-binding NarL/FixJ family response regulator
MAVAHTIRVLVVDDHPLLRSGIAAVVAGAQDIGLVAEATRRPWIIFEPTVRM